MINTAKTSKRNIVFGIVAGVLTVASLLHIKKAHADVSFTCTPNGGFIQCGRGWSGYVYGDRAELTYSPNKSGAQLKIWFWAPDFAKAEITYEVSDKTVDLRCFRVGYYWDCRE